jgi:hypothetical protein
MRERFTEFRERQTRRKITWQKGRRGYRKVRRMRLWRGGKRKKKKIHCHIF